MIKRFQINGLFGFRNVDILFDSNIKILIGENGLGKTTILNSIYFLLSKNFNKLYQIDFEDICLEFKNNDKIHFKKIELENYLNRERANIRLFNTRMIKKKIESKINRSLFNVKDIKNEKDIHKIVKDIIEKDSSFKRLGPLNIVEENMYDIILDKFNIQKTASSISIAIDLIDKNTNDILYFPTYRRVEEDLKNLERNPFLNNTRNNFSNVEFGEDVIEFEPDDLLIHFGMEDVKLRIQKILSDIKESSIKGFSKVTGEMLSQLLKGFPTIHDKDIEKLDMKTVQIIVHRVGDDLNKNDRNRILSLLDDIEELKKKKELVYFIFKLIDIYNEQKYLDDSIKKFRDVCNKYLVDKEFRYNESLVDLSIYRIDTDDKVDLSNLSSGEKQIVSLFSKLYFEELHNLLILFDEPELSLSIEWQKRLLPDVMDSEKCSFLLAVTHSPFIFKNDLEDFAIGMKTYVK